MPEINRFYPTNALYFDAEPLERNLDRARRMATELRTGATGYLPDGVLGMLDENTKAVNNPFLGDLRQSVVDLMGEPPYDAERARAVGKRILTLMYASQQARIAMKLDDAAAALFWETR